MAPHHNIRCHSPYKHYMMFHNNNSCCGGGICNSIWGARTTNYNITINDGGFWGGFRNGLGMGFGNLIGGLFGGFMGGLFGGGMFGGWGGMFGGMGFGFPSFGGGWGGWGGGYGNYGNNNSSRVGDTDDVSTAGRKTKTKAKTKTKSTDTPDTKTECKDADNAKILDLDKRLNALDKSNDPSEAIKLYKEITELINKPVDDEHKDENIANYKEKLNRLKNNWNFTDDGKGNISATKKTTEPNNGNAANVGTDPNAAPAQDNKVKIGGKDIDLTTITLDQIKVLSDDDLAGITQDDATKILKQLGYIDNEVGKMSNSYAILKLLEKSGMTVEVETRPSAGENQDKWIKGPISNVEKDSNGKLSYNVNCSDTDGAIYKAMYKFTAQKNDNKTYKVTSDNTTINVNKKINITYEGEKMPLKNNTSVPLVTKKS